MHIKEILELMNYQLASTTDYLWTSFGENAKFWDFYDTEENETCTAITNSKMEVVCLEAFCDYLDEPKMYRWVDEKYKESFMNENNEKSYEENEYRIIDCETCDDILTKMKAILNRQNFDQRIKVPIELSDDLFLFVAKQAHEKDITFNQEMEHVLKTIIEKEKLNQGLSNDLNELTYPQQKLPSTPKYNNLSNVDKSSTFIVPVEQDGDDYIITFPDEVLQKTGWKIGDTLNCEEKDNGTIVVTKVK